MKRIAGTKWTKKDVKPYYVLAAIFNIAGTLVLLPTLLLPTVLPYFAGFLFISGTVFALISAGIAIAVKQDERRNIRFCEENRQSRVNHIP